MGINTNRQLAYALGVTQQAVYHAQKNAVPMNWVVGAAQAANVSIDWLLSGQPVGVAEKANGDDALGVFRYPQAPQNPQVPSFSGVVQNLMEAMKLESETELVAKLEVPPDSFEAARKQGVFPPDWLLRIARMHHIQISQILPSAGNDHFGDRSPVFCPGAPSPADPEGGQGSVGQVQGGDPAFSDFVASNYCLIPKCRPLIGPDSLLLRDEGSPPLAFGRGWLGNWGDPVNMVVLEVSGEHLEPLLFDGDMVLLDCSRRTPMTGRFFAVSIDGHAVIRRIDLLPGRIVLCSENKKYGPLEIANDVNGFSILGMAIWFGRKLVDS